VQSGDVCIRMIVLSGLAVGAGSAETTAASSSAFSMVALLGKL
jgi:hypothetical protein